MALLAGAALVAIASLGAPTETSGQTGGQREAARLEQNVPNPFTPGFSQTIIAYRLASSGRVRLTVYNRLAQEVAVLVDREEGAGRYVVSWEGTAANGEPVPQGIYWYDLQVDGQRIALRQMRVLESSAAPEGEAGPPGRDDPPLATLRDRAPEPEPGFELSEFRREVARSFRTWWASLH